MNNIFVLILLDLILLNKTIKIVNLYYVFFILFVYFRAQYYQKLDPGI